LLKNVASDIETITVSLPQHLNLLSLCVRLSQHLSWHQTSSWVSSIVLALLRCSMGSGDHYHGSQVTTLTTVLTAKLFRMFKESRMYQH